MTTAPYTGRFAPTPSGPLHLGSLLCALASWLDARAHAGRWLLRIDDYDQPRCRPDAERIILATLEAYGLEWDRHGDAGILRQSTRLEAYRSALGRISAGGGRLYSCACSRSMLRGVRPYPGTCRYRHLPTHGMALRLQVPSGETTLVDGIHGPIGTDLARTTGDFIVWRADGLPGYALSTVVDDIHQGITHVVRGADLLSEAGAQLWLYGCLGAAVPRFAHVPLIRQADGRKLSKSLRAAPIATDSERARRVTLAHALELLGQGEAPLRDLDSCRDMLQWATRNWRIGRVPRAVEHFAAI